MNQKNTIILANYILIKNVFNITSNKTLVVNEYK